MMIKNLDGSKIIALLHELDSSIKAPCRIVICGGAAAILGYGLKRYTGDIDILEPSPKSQIFHAIVKDISENHGLDPNWINDSVKGFIDCLSPDFQKRLAPLDADFKNLEAFILSKPDFITMKICAWREADRQDITSIGISEADISIINKNLAHYEKLRPDKAQKAHMVLSELGIHKTKELKAHEVSNLSELILFYSQQTLKTPSIEDIRKWKEQIEDGATPGAVASTIANMKRTK